MLRSPNTHSKVLVHCDTVVLLFMEIVFVLLDEVNNFIFMVCFVRCYRFQLEITKACAFKHHFTHFTEKLTW